MSTHYEKLITKLRELFELDKADLDFGIYRIIAQRQDEIQQFLDHDLKRSVKSVLQDNEGEQLESLQRELEAAIKSMQDLGMEPSSSPKVKELEEKVAAFSGSEYQEIQTYEHLYTFFSRYYDEGDFISQRRVSKDARYAIPYNGEEVKLHWANADQYYIKSSENFRDYRFKLSDGCFVNFKLLDADSSRDNTKGDKRFFMLAEDPVVELENGELQIGFNYQGLEVNQKKVIAVDGKEKPASQKVFNELALQAVEQKLPEAWKTFLLEQAPTKTKPKRTLLEKQINDYSAKNSFDYFIHKDLSGFLSRELDFYIKNEVMELDDVVQADESKLGEMLQQIKAIRRVAELVIAFLAQLENFQRKLWLKKKFVVKSDYCFTLDRLPESLYPTIAANHGQRKEWIGLGFIEDNVEITTEFLNANPFLLVDTQHFELIFKYDCLGHIDDIDAQCDGLLVHGDNYQALKLLQARFQEKVKCLYIDPPYNSDGDGFLYKDSYRNSSWLSMLYDRLELSKSLLSKDGTFFSHIDDKDENNRVTHRYMGLLESIFGNRNYLDNLIWVKNATHNDTSTFSHNHEYILAFSKDRSIASSEHDMFRQAKPGYQEVMALVADLNESYPELLKVRESLRKLYKKQSDDYKNECLKYGLSWSDEVKRNNPWKGIRQYKYADYRTADGVWVDEANAKRLGAKIWVYREDNPSWPNASSLKEMHKDIGHDEYRFYMPAHPITNAGCPAPKRGWLWRCKPNTDRKQTLSFEYLLTKHLIHFGEDENKVPQYKRFLQNVDSDVVKSIITDFTDGEKELADISGERGTFPNPKPTALGKKIYEITTNYSDTVMDLFAGSGTSIDAVIKQNALDGKGRKFIGIELGTYFEKILLPRVKRVIFSTSWKSGVHQSKSNLSTAFKTLKLEGYEDTQNNLILERSGQQQALLDSEPSLKQDYTLNYMLDIESKGSLLNIEAFEQPFKYQMNIATDSAGETRLQNIDLIETFNYLIGLTVHTLEKTTVAIEFDQDGDGIWQALNKPTRCEEGADNSYTFVIITGELPNGDSSLLIWRVLNNFSDPQSKLLHNMAADAFVMNHLRVNTKDKEIDAIFVNGDNTLPNIRSGEEHWKVRLIEEEFQRLMFLEQ